MMSRSTSLYEVLIALDSFIDREGHACVPRTHIEGGIRLGDAVEHVRSLHEEGTLPAKAAAALAGRAGWFWGRGDTVHHVLVAAVGEFIAVHGHAKFPKGSELAAAAESVRADLADGRIERDLFEALHSFPEWRWESDYDYGWNDRYRELQAFVAANGHARIPERINGASRLASWATWQRNRFGTGELEPSRRHRLEMIEAWEWHPQAGKREVYVVELRKFVAKYGHGAVRSNYVTDEGYRLGASLSRVRGDYRRGKLPARRIALLESIEGWTWDLPPVEPPVNDTAVAAFRSFVDREGHGAVPYAHCEGSFHLGSYLTNVRFRLKKGELATPQRKALDAVDVAWRRGTTAPDEQQLPAMEQAAA